MLSLRIFAAVLGLTLLASFGSAENSWQRTQWNEEAAWVSGRAGLKAIVSEARGRVIYFGAENGAHNLLSAPVPRQAPSAKEAAPNWGGHRFWLGPQSRWKWPPPKDWEFSPVQSAEATGSKLVLRSFHRDDHFPEIEREYAWEDRGFRCTARWRGAGRPWYAMHVVAIDLPAEVEVELHPWEHAPQGLVGVRDDRPNTSPLPHAAVQKNKERAVIRSGIAVGKFGLAPQSLLVRRGNLDLVLSPGPVHGTPIESPDFGYLTQIWVGNASATFCELEQLTPYLLPAADGWCCSSVYLEAGQGVSNSARQEADEPQP